MSLSTIISTNGVDLPELFVELYNSAKIFNHSAIVVITRGDAERILRKQLQFGKFCGKYMNVDLSTPTINLYWYNRQAGTNAGQAVIRKIKGNQYRKAPESALRELNARRNPAVHTRENRTTDFIPNPVNNSRNTAFMYGNNNNSMMNIIHPPRRARIVNTSGIINPATLPAITYEKKRIVQVINPRFNPDLYSMSKDDVQQILNHQGDDEQQPEISPKTIATKEPEHKTPKELEYKTTKEPEQKTTKDQEYKTTKDQEHKATREPVGAQSTSFSYEPEPVRMPRPAVEPVVQRETHVPVPEPVHVTVPKDEPMAIPMDGVVIDAVVDGIKKTNEPPVVNRFQRRNKKVQQ